MTIVFMPNRAWVTRCAVAESSWPNSSGKRSRDDLPGEAELVLGEPHWDSSPPSQSASQ